SGAAPINADILKFFHAIGIPIAEVYGQTEDCGPTTLNPRDRIKIGTVGPAIPGVEVRIAEDGEVLARGGNVFPGYFKNEETTAKFAADRGLGTADLAELSQNPEVLASVEGAVEAVNAGFSRAEQIKRWTVLPRDFLQEEDEVTPTLKVRRRAIIQKYADDI